MSNIDPKPLKQIMIENKMNPNPITSCIDYIVNHQATQHISDLLGNHDLSYCEKVKEEAVKILNQKGDMEYSEPNLLAIYQLAEGNMSQDVEPVSLEDHAIVIDLPDAMALIGSIQDKRIQYSSLPISIQEKLIALKHSLLWIANHHDFSIPEALTEEFRNDIISNPGKEHLALNKLYKSMTEHDAKVVYDLFTNCQRTIDEHAAEIKAATSESPIESNNTPFEHFAFSPGEDLRNITMDEYLSKPDIKLQTCITILKNKDQDNFNAIEYEEAQAFVDGYKDQYKKLIANAIKNNYYLDCIIDHSMPYDRAQAIITSAGFNIPVNHKVIAVLKAQAANKKIEDEITDRYKKIHVDHLKAVQVEKDAIHQTDSEALSILQGEAEEAARLASLRDNHVKSKVENPITLRDQRIATIKTKKDGEPSLKDQMLSNRAKKMVEPDIKSNDGLPEFLRNAPDVLYMNDNGNKQEFKRTWNKDETRFEYLLDGQHGSKGYTLKKAFELLSSGAMTKQ
jgi:hypothetical protein